MELDNIKPNENCDIEITGTIVKVSVAELGRFAAADFIAKLAKSFNGDDVNVDDCIYKSKKKYKQQLKFE
jgi:hypothetical protein